MILQETFPHIKVKRVYFKEYSHVTEINHTQYHILVLPVTKNSILTINSQYMWEIKYGKQVGSRFNTTSTKLINLKNFQTLNNKMIVFKAQPYKIYKHINESDLIDISDSKEIFGITLFESLK